MLEDLSVNPFKPLRISEQFCLKVSSNLYWVKYYENVTITWGMIF